ncbi:LacI family transcriptional regulator [Paracoccus acridae]|uniref:LacI family transcriptional regulator n=1 Tax=Paracoccus acridae TaxID=1795310 RepID=A0ABQ1VLN2_9RHOB|nr:LacI family DNA-binding transcriptional regulator [Paracoccus acridae]GGF73574.1 LacI family transcriptional regulator [Paracoccus acridae]
MQTYRRDIMAIGIKDIARLAGVSTATVSRALSHPGRVSPETRAQVMAVVEEHDYRVNSFARSLRVRRADAVLALVPNLGNPFFSEIIAGIQDGLTPAGLDLLVTDSLSQQARRQSPVTHLQAARADGLICLDGALPAGILDDLAASDVAGRVVFACEWPDGRGFPVVRSDNRAGMALAVQHLVGLGHRDFALLTGPEGNVLTRERREGAEAALAQAGLSLPPSRIAGGSFEIRDGFRAAGDLMRMPSRPTAILCSSDQLAIGCISGLSELGVRVPQDVSVVGFDDIALAAYSRPPLTTIRQDRRRLGRIAAERLLSSLSGKPLAETLTTLPVEIVVRRSTAAAPAG